MSDSVGMFIGFFSFCQHGGVVLSSFTVPTNSPILDCYIVSHHRLPSYSMVSTRISTNVSLQTASSCTLCKLSAASLALDLLALPHPPASPSMASTNKAWKAMLQTSSLDRLYLLSHPTQPPPPSTNTPRVTYAREKLKPKSRNGMPGMPAPA